MTVLSRDILASHGPFIRFADCPRQEVKGEFSHPNRSNFEDNVFFEMSESLLDAFRSLTKTAAPIDPREFVQLDDPCKIRKLASELLVWTFVLTSCRSQVLADKVEGQWSFYADSLRDRHGRNLSGEDLRLDMLETLLLLIGRLFRIARSNRYLVIEGV